MHLHGRARTLHFSSPLLLIRHLLATVTSRRCDVRFICAYSVSVPDAAALILVSICPSAPLSFDLSSRALYLLALRLSLSLSLLMLYHGSPRHMLCRPHTPTDCSLCRCWCLNPDRVQAPPAIVHLCICTANIVVPASFCSDDPLFGCRFAAFF